jgi:ParB/RepB/Spo0J family partition protein
MRSTLLHIDAIRPDPGNPNCRKVLRGIPELAQSIRDVGLLQPLSVRPDPELGNGYYLIVFGHRRHAACKVASFQHVPCMVMNADLGKISTTKLRLIENLHQDPMTPVEKARAFDDLRNSGPGDPISVATLSSIVHLSSATIRRYLLILELSDKTIADIEADKIRWQDAIAHVTEIKRLRKGFSKDGKKAASTRKIQMAPVTFTATHQLAAQAKRRCIRATHLVPAESVACIDCWEAIIRADERAKLSVTLRAPDSSDGHIGRDPARPVPRSRFAFPSSTLTS